MIQAVGFTGSRRGGLALLELAARRARPIPVYAEMSSVNPVFVLPGALAERADTLATEFVESLTAGVGQFCTNPGLVLGLAGPDFERFSCTAAQALVDKPAGVMLSACIAQAYRMGTAQLSQHMNVRQLGTGGATEGECQAQPALFAVRGADVLSDTALTDEIFGPCSLLIACADVAQMQAVAKHLDGQLTATVHLEAADHALTQQLLPILERRVGRILANGWPTGVEVCDAMVHGGPFPATSDARTTSVGTAAIERFLRPVSYQAWPQALLPVALRDTNPLQLRRLIDGVATTREAGTTN